LAVVPADQQKNGVIPAFVVFLQEKKILLIIVE
jgi:hypothetical protein